MNIKSDRPKSKSGLKILYSLLPFIKPYKQQIFLALFVLIIAACATLTLPFGFRRLIDSGFSDKTNANFENIDLYFFQLFVIACILAIATASRFYLVSWLGERVTSNIRQKVFSHILFQTPEFFETTQTGEVLSRLTTDTTLVQTVVGTSVSMALRNFLLLIGALIMIFITNVKLSAIIVLILLAVIIPIMFFGRKVRKLSRDSQDKIASASGIAGEILNSTSTVQSFNNENFESNRFFKAIEKAFNTSIKRVRARSLLTAVAILFIFSTVVFVLWLGAYSVVNNEMSIGELTQFIFYAVIISGSIGAIAEILGDLQRAAGATERLLELLSEDPKIKNPSNPISFPKKSENNINLKVENLSFSYPSRPNQLSLKNISFEISHGETVAIVGPSGAGKTTLFQLILRLYDPNEGYIYLDNIDIKKAKLKSVRENIGIVTQETTIFSTNAFENIRYGKPNASDHEVITAAKLAAAHDFITKLPDSYDTFLGERGVRLSGGQKQRIAIARVLLKNPPLILLDEATSSLDAESEQLIKMALEAAMKDRTTIIIAHRLATIKKANRILVMKEGEIIEVGDHFHLIKSGGLYANLANLQFSNN